MANGKGKKPYFNNRGNSFKGSITFLILAATIVAAFFYFGRQSQIQSKQQQYYTIKEGEFELELDWPQNTDSLKPIKLDSVSNISVTGKKKIYTTNSTAKKVKIDFSYEEAGLPTTFAQEPVIKHYAFTLSYSEQHEQARWVSYVLKAEHLEGRVARQDDYRPDLAIITGSADLTDYRRSGYDRGHLVPAADMKWNERAMSETFLLSNISPQNKSFNAGVWEKLESKIRVWARQDGEIYIVTGPVLHDSLLKIGVNGVSVPEYFYKVVLDARQPELKGIGFIIPNQPSSASFWNYVVTIQEVEKKTGLDFFSALPDSIEYLIESTLDLKSWK